MKCPACGKDLTPLRAGDITVDSCAAGCGGIWFDNFELQKVDDLHEAAADILMKPAMPQPLMVKASRRHLCPKCADTIMMRHFVSRQKEVEVDECPNCGGHWLDAGELARIRSERELDRAERKAKEERVSRASGTRRPRRTS